MIRRFQEPTILIIVVILAALGHVACGRSGRQQDAAVEGWERSRSEATETLDRLRDRIEEVSSAFEGQKQVLDRRDERRRPVTGRFEGLDGGDYDASRISLVSDVQRAPRERGYYYAGPADGYLGRPTMEALARYQKEHGLRPSGIRSPKTRSRLLGG